MATTSLNTNNVESFITKSRSDLKSYKLVNLDNGLEILLVDSSKLAESRKKSPDDKEASSKAAAAMFVSVGSFADPAVAEGVAHFLEHMIFMGIDSPKYPQSENLYDSFVSSHGGGCNAYTEGEHTVYEFDIAAEHFAAALDIFACCFISPLLSESSSDREIKAIESEFCLAKVSDDARLEQLMCNSAKSDHVLRKFAWGNMNSLSAVPTANNVDVHSILKQFYKKHYIPTNMKLVVLAPTSLDELEKEVRSAFGNWVVPPTDSADVQTKKKKKVVEEDVKESGDSLPSLEECIGKFRNVSPFATDDKTYVTRVIPMKKTHKLLMNWYLPPCVADYKKKTVHYIGHLLGHEGPGSLLSALKASGLATGVEAGSCFSNMESNSMFSLFPITVNLTTKGIANWVTVAGRVFEYIALLKKEGPKEWIHEEIRRAAEIAFDFRDEECESNFVETLCVQMGPYHKRDRKDLLTAAFLHESWDPSAVTASLELMVPQTCRFELLSSAFVSKNANDDEGEDEEDDEEDDDEDDDDDDDDDDSEEEEDEDIAALYEGPAKWKSVCALPPQEGPKSSPPLVEPHFGTLYWTEPLPQALIELWRTVKPSADLHLPPPNLFIPEDLSLDAELQRHVDASKEGYTGDYKGSTVSAPEKLRTEDGLHVWHLLDFKFPAPKVEISCQFSSKVPQASPLNAAEHQLFEKLIGDCLNETIYMSEMAELNCAVRGTSSSIVLEVSGFSDKACLLMEMLTAALFNPAQYLTEAAVQRQIELLKRRYTNANLKSSEASYNARLEALAPMQYSSEAKLSALLDQESNVANDVKKKTKASAKKQKGTAAVKSSPALQGASDYASSFLSGLSVECLVQGNISAQRAEALSDKLKAIVQAYAEQVKAVHPFGDSHHPPQQIVLLPLDRVVLLSVAPKNPLETNKCVETYFQLGPYCIENLTALELLEQSISEPYFDSLRSKQQLGYSVGCGVRQTYGMLGLYFDVTSSSHSIDDIHKAIFAFVDAVPSLIHALSPEVYQNHVNTQINQKSRADPSLYDAAAFNWYEITEGKVDFALRAKQAELLKNPNSHLLQQDALEHFATDLLKSARRLLVVHAELPSAAPPSKSPAQSITFGSLCPDVEVVHVKSASEVHSLGTIVVPLSQDKK